MSRTVFAAGVAAAVLAKALHSMTYWGDDVAYGGHVESVPYSEFAAKAKSGDLILTSGMAFTSVSRLFTKSIWSHCGIVWRDPKTGALYEWSSHNGGEEVLNDRGPSRPVSGTQLVPLEYLAADNGCICWRPVDLDDSQRKRLGEVIDALKYRVEFASIPEWVAHMGGVMKLLFENSGWGMLCSHTVALTYAAIDAIALDRGMTGFVPKTFSDEGDAVWQVPVSDTVKYVVGFDTKSLVNLSPKKHAA